MSGGSKTTTIVQPSKPTALEESLQRQQLQVGEAQLSAIEQQTVVQERLFDELFKDKSAFEVQLDVRRDELELDQLERAIRLGPLEEKLVQLQLDAIENPGANDKQIAQIEEAIQAAQISGEADITRFTSDALTQVKDVLAPRRGLRPTDTPIIDRGKEIAKRGIDLKGDLTKKLAEIGATAKLNFPLAVSQFQAGAAGFGAQVSEAAQQFQQQLTNSAFINRLNLTNLVSGGGLGLASIGVNASGLFGDRGSTTTTTKRGGSSIGGIGSILSGVGSLAPFFSPAGAGAIFGTQSTLACWIAREVFGEDNPKWVQFWEYLETKAPKWFYDFYLENGEAIAEEIKDKPEVKSKVRDLMELVLTNAY